MASVRWASADRAVRWFVSLMRFDTKVFTVSDFESAKELLQFVSRSTEKRSSSSSDMLVRVTNRAMRPSNIGKPGSVSFSASMLVYGQSLLNQQCVPIILPSSHCNSTSTDPKKSRSALAASAPCGRSTLLD